MNGMRWLTLGFAGVAVALLGAILLQRQERAVLQGEIELRRRQGRELAELRTEHERLRAIQLPEAEFERLRNDHHAMLGLRAEIEQMKTRAEKMGRTLEKKGR